MTRLDVPANDPLRMFAMRAAATLRRSKAGADCWCDARTNRMAMGQHTDECVSLSALYHDAKMHARYGTGEGGAA